MSNLAVILVCLCMGCSVVPSTKSGGRILVLDFETVEASEGSGFFIAPDVFVTALHTLKAGEPLGVILEDGSRVDIIETLAEDAERDVAVLKLDTAEGEPLKLSDRPPKAGDQVWTVTRFGAHEGVVGAEMIDPTLGQVLLLAAPLKPGASGGAVVDTGGNVVGMIHGAVEDDPGRIVVIPAAALAELGR